MQKVGEIVLCIQKKGNGAGKRRKEERSHIIQQYLGGNSDVSRDQAIITQIRHNSKSPLTTLPRLLNARQIIICSMMIFILVSLFV